jgi:hypothetical protein
LGRTKGLGWKALICKWTGSRGSLRVALLRCLILGRSEWTLGLCGATITGWGRISGDYRIPLLLWRPTRHQWTARNTLGLADSNRVMAGRMGWHLHGLRWLRCGAILQVG